MKSSNTSYCWWEAPAFYTTPLANHYPPNNMCHFLNHFPSHLPDLVSHNKYSDLKTSPPHSPTTLHTLPHNPRQIHSHILHGNVSTITQTIIFHSRFIYNVMPRHIYFTTTIFCLQTQPHNNKIIKHVNKMIHTCELKSIRLLFLLPYVYVWFVLEACLPVLVASVYHRGDKMRCKIFLHHHLKCSINICLSLTIWLATHLKYCTPLEKWRTVDANGWL